jgi:hypothetical protein
MQLLLSLFEPQAMRRVGLVRVALLALLVAACAYRAWLVFRFNPVDHIWSDAARHWEAGVNALSGAQMTLIDPILYQIYIGILAKLTLKVPLLVAFWTALLSLSGPWLWYRFLRELLPTRDWALAGWVLLAALPSWSAIYSYFMQETLMLPLLGAALWATWRCRRKGDRASFVIAVGIWLLAGLTRGICLPLGAVAMAWLWFAQDDKFAKAATSLALLLAVMGPLAARSWAMTGMIAPHGNGELAQLYNRAGTMTMSIDFMRGNRLSSTYKFLSPALEHPPFEPFSDWRTRREWNAHFTIDQHAGARDWRAAKESLPPWDWSRLAWLTGDNLIHLFFSRTWPDTDLDRGIGQVNYWLRWIWAPLAVLCLVMTLATWRRERERLLPTLLLVWFVVQGLLPISVNEGRYRKPFEGLLIAQCLLLAAGGRRSRERDLSNPPDPAPGVRPVR